MGVAHVAAVARGCAGLWEPRRQSGMRCPPWTQRLTDASTTHSLLIRPGG
jgi:hypothetical protein